MGLPIIGTAQLAFESDEGWLGNFKMIISTKDFQNAVLNTLLLAAICIPIQLALSIFLAILVNKKFKGYQTLLYIIASPLALSDITAALISYSIFAPNGYLNRILLSINWIERPIYFFWLHVQVKRNAGHNNNRNMACDAFSFCDDTSLIAVDKQRIPGSSGSFWLQFMAEIVEDYSSPA